MCVFIAFQMRVPLARTEQLRWYNVEIREIKIRVLSLCVCVRCRHFSCIIRARLHFPIEINRGILAQLI